MHTLINCNNSFSKPITVIMTIQISRIVGIPEGISVNLVTPIVLSVSQIEDKGISLDLLATGFDIYMPKVVNNVKKSKYTKSSK